MSLAPGTRLGAYDVLAKLGEGGMGEVFRARDTTLGREVALKVLPDQVAGDPERLRRFEREAKTLAALNHPHIAHVYGFEQSGDTAALVMELVPGESLAHRITRNQAGGAPGLPRPEIGRRQPRGLPIREALELARQIADGLGAAHEQGIVHRDLKPANVQVTPDGVAKLLDFGLAKPAPEGRGFSPGPTDDAATLTSPAAVTEPGVVLGTAAYMSPEQARGLPVDARTDIWAFGCVLYEMLTGVRAIPGTTTTDLLVAILERDPDWTCLPTTTPSSVRALLRRCLKKDGKQRLHDIVDARFVLEDALAALAAPSSGLGVETGGVGAVATQPARAVWRHRLSLGLALIALAIGGGLGWWLGRAPEPSAGAVVRLTMPVQPLAVLNHASSSAVAISPDGSRVAFVAGDKNIGQLYLRRLDMTEAEPVKGASEALSPFWSPDGVWLVYVNAGKLTKLRIADGQTVVLADTPGIHGGTMSADGTVVVGGGRELRWGISRISPEGGSPEVLVAPDPARSEVYLCWPTFLPDGQTVIYTVVSGNGVGFEVVALSLADKTRKVVMTGPLGNVRYVAPGSLVFQQAGTLSAVRFDLASLTVSGSPSRMVLDPLWMLPAEPTLSHFDIAPSGTLVYLPHGGRQPREQLVWVDRAGREEPLPDLVAQMGADTVSGTALPRISPDGQRLALVHMNYVSSKGRLPERDVWIYDFSRGTLGRLPSRTMPQWMPDGERLASGAVQDSAYGNGLVIERADGAGAPTEILPFQDGREPVPGSVSRDGRYLLYTLIQPPAPPDIHRMDLDRRTSEVLIGGPGGQFQPALSPDERWLVYGSNETGRAEVYLTDYPARQRRWQLTSKGGGSPAWGPDGREVFFQPGAESGGLWRVGLGSGPVPAPGEPSALFDGPFARGGAYGRAYDVSPDGRRFLMTRRPDFGPVRGQLSVVLNWTRELRERLPR